MVGKMLYPYIFYISNMYVMFSIQIKPEEPEILVMLKHYHLINTGLHTPWERVHNHLIFFFLMFHVLSTCVQPLQRFLLIIKGCLEKSFQ